MKKIIFGLLAFLLLLTPAIAIAQTSTLDFQDKKIVVLAPDEVINKDYFAAGELVEISGTVNGDVYVAGGQVYVDGTINGDLLVAGGTVTISGEVTQNVRAAGGQITVTGNIGRNTTIVGGNIELTDEAKLNGSLVVAGGNVTIASTVAKDVNAGVGTMRITSNAQINGSINYFSEEAISIANSASVSGAVVQHKVPGFRKPDTQEVKQFASGFSIFTKLVSFVSTLILGLLLIKLFPNCVKRASDVISKEFLKSIGVGTLVIIVVPILILTLLVTFVAMPLGFMLSGVFVIYLYFVRIYAMVTIGQKLVEWTKIKVESLNWIFVIGLIVYFLLSIIPIVGGLIKLFILVASLGAAITNDRKTYSQALKAKVF